jgi:hypothetical protein
MDKDELITHTVKIDKYIELNLNIPKVMTPMELKALTTKANKIFNLAEVPIVEKKKRGLYGRNGYFKPHMDAQLYKLREIQHKSWGKIAKIMNEDKDRVNKRVYYLKNKGRWNKSLLEVKTNATKQGSGEGEVHSEGSETSDNS